MKWTLFISFLIGSFAIASESPPTPSSSKIVPFVKELVEAYKSKEESAFPILVIMAKQADLSSVAMTDSKVSRGRRVYDALRNAAISSQGEIVKWLKSQNVEFQQFYVRNMVAIENSTPELVNQLAARSDVAKIIGNPTIKNNLNLFDGSQKIFGRKSIEGNISSIGAPEVWTQFGARGKGIVVAGQDTGYQWDHPALKKKYRGYTNDETVNHNYNWHDSIRHRIGSEPHNKCGYGLKAPCDDDLHGTHTMGTMVGDDEHGNQIGVAPDAQWIGCRNMDQGLGRPTTYIECFEFFLAPYPVGGVAWTDGKPELAPHVMNNSWTCPASEGCEGSEMVPVLEALYKAGVMVVVSAGNEGPGCSTVQDQPADISPTTFSVGAHDYRNGKIATFSSRGPSKLDGKQAPDISAPGVGIRSSTPGNSYTGGWDGTSMAGPHVVGQVALMMSANNKLIGNVDKTAEIIRSTAVHMAVSARNACGGELAAPNNVYGYGRIDALAAVKAALQVR